MDRSVLIFSCFFFLMMTFVDNTMALKHRDRGGSRREHESLLDKQERDRNEKERKTDDGKKDEGKRNVTCYQCAGDQCNDPFRFDNSTPTVLCPYGCWKGVLAAAVRRGCGSKRCTVTFQGGSGMSNTCCQTDRCNRTSIQQGSLILLVASLFVIMANIKRD